MKFSKVSWLSALKARFSQPKKEESIENILHHAKVLNLISPEALTMIEGVLQISQMQARDIMIPRAQIAVINKQADIKTIVELIQNATHSRYPVIDESRDDIEGLVLAKDLLPFAFNPEKKFELRNILRPVMFIPESKRLNSLLKEFRDKKSHMAIVIDEYGGVAGLVTLEDVLEQIVGEIDDEYDIDPENLIKPLNEKVYVIKAFTPLKEFNEHFDKALDSADCDTIGGLLVKHVGHLPKPNEIIQIENYQFKILHADSRHVRVLELTILD